MRHKAVTLLLMLVVLLTSARLGYSQNSAHSTQAQSSNSSQRAELITRCEKAADEVYKGRIYIHELEAQLKATEGLLADAEKLNDEGSAEIKKLRTERDELRTALDLERKAQAERVKQLAKMQIKLNKAEASKRFWRKVALVSIAVGAAVVVLRR